MKKLLFSIVLLALSVNAFAAQLYPLKFHWNTTSGRASGYKVYTCTAGTSCGPGISANDKDTYTTSDQATTNANPVVLDSRGEADIFFNGLYKIVVCDTNDANCVTEDNWGHGYTVTSVGASATNLIPNASFEIDTNSDSTPDGWVLTSYTGATNTLDTSDQYHGAQSGKFTSVGNGGGYYTSEDFIEITEGRTYTISFAVKSSVVDVRNLAQILYYTSAKASVSTVSIWDESAANPTSWTIKEFEETPPATARYAKLIFYGAHSSDATAGTTRYDNVRLAVKADSGSISIKTTTYTVVAADNGGTLLISTASGVWTLTLPATATVDDGFSFTAKMATNSGGKLTISADGSDTIGIDGDSTLVLGIPSQTVKFVKQGTAWQIVHLNPLNNILIYDEKSNTTGGGTSSSGVNTRVLNTEKSDTGNNAALSSNQITLSAGTYRIVEGSAPQQGGGLSKVYLYNTTGAADILIGANETTNVRSNLHAGDQFTIAASQALELRHYITTGISTVGLGEATSSGDVERYAVFSIERIQ